MPTEKSRERKTISSIKQFIVVGSLVAMLVVFIFLSVKNFFARPSGQNLREEDIVREVGRVTNLPSGDPQIKRVERPELLRELNPRAYGDVQENDLILEYASKLLIYRPGEDRVIRIVEK